MDFKYRSMEQKSREQWQGEIAAYHELLDLVRDIPDFSRVEQHALAFVIEDIRQRAPEHWEQNLAAFKDSLRQLKEHGELPELTWNLAQEFNRRYDAFLADLEAREQNPVRQKNLKVLREGLARDMEIRQKIYQSGERVPIGSVILEHLPKWFQ